MEIFSIKTRLVNPPKDDIYELLDEYCPDLDEGDVFLIASKVLSIHQSRCLPIDSVASKEDLIKKEADFFVPASENIYADITLSIKGNTLIGSAGIDESNASGHYILWPKKPEKEAKKICQYLKNKFKLKKLAVIITDSHSVPLRWGVLGVSIGFFGLKPLKDYRNTKDLFGRTIKHSQGNIVDALAVMGVLAMGEGSEQTPIAIIKGADFIEFTEAETYQDSLVSPEEDLFFPLLKKFKRS